jgi:tetratricopeptide (TPR) repeat protein
MVRQFCSWLLLPLTLVLPGTLFAQIQQLGNIRGQIRVAGGDLPARQILVELRVHGGTLNSIYADARGYFGFGGLLANEYHVVINDEAYAPADERADVDPQSSTVTVVQVTLVPREDKKKDDPIGVRAAGSNPDLVSPADYNQRFPRKAVKQYQRGVDAEHEGKREEAIARYESALKIAPDYYPARNNLGALYLGKSDFKAAEEQFREAVRLDRNEAQAYFNLSNVLMLTHRIPEAETTLALGLQRRPDSAFGYFLQGCLYVRTGKLAEAESSLQNALRLDAKMPQAYLQLVNLYLRQNRREDAIAQLQVFLKDFPTAAAAPKAQEILKKLQKEESAVKR